MLQARELASELAVLAATAGGGLDAELKAAAQGAQARQAIGDACYREAAAAAAEMFASCHAAALQVRGCCWHCFVLKKVALVWEIGNACYKEAAAAAAAMFASRHSSALHV